MKLFYSRTSPYARKVRVTAEEKGLAERLELYVCDPHEKDPRLLAVNPLSRVPTLVMDDGEPLFDSPVICEWLDSLVEWPRLIPQDGPQRWAVLRGQALADGMLDDAVGIVMERKRSRQQQSAELNAARATALMRCIDLCESDLSWIPGPLNLAHIAVGCTLGYLDFRLPEIEWRREHPKVEDWFEELAGRPSMRSTEPPRA